MDSLYPVFHSLKIINKAAKILRDEMYQLERAEDESLWDEINTLYDKQKKLYNLKDDVLEKLITLSEVEKIGTHFLYENETDKVYGDLYRPVYQQYWNYTYHRLRFENKNHEEDCEPLGKMIQSAVYGGNVIDNAIEILERYLNGTLDEKITLIDKLRLVKKIENELSAIGEALNAEPSIDSDIPTYFTEDGEAITVNGKTINEKWGYIKSYYADRKYEAVLTDDNSVILYGENDETYSVVEYNGFTVYNYTCDDVCPFELLEK